MGSALGCGGVGKEGAGAGDLLGDRRGGVDQPQVTESLPKFAGGERLRLCARITEGEGGRGYENGGAQMRTVIKTF